MVLIPFPGVALSVTILDEAELECGNRWQHKQRSNCSYAASEGVDADFGYIRLGKIKI